MLPEYACAIILDSRGYLLLQLRPSTATHAPDQLTCFGGRREAGEDDQTCILRELNEELRWTPNSIRAGCELWQSDRFIARFFHTSWDGKPFTLEFGHLAVWAPLPAIPGLPLSRWHQLVIAAIAQGRSRVDIA